MKKRTGKIVALLLSVILVIGSPIVALAESGLMTNLTGLVGISGTWMETENGLYSSGNGDRFAISETVGADFIYTATVDFSETRNNGAGSLVFRSNETGRSSYVANIDLNQGNARIFKFVNGIASDVGSYRFAVSKKAYQFKIEAIGTSLKMYVDDVLVISGNDSTFQAGRFGLLTYNDTIIYNNIYYTPINTVPQLASLELSDGVALSPAFSPNITAYDILSDYDVSQVKVKAVPEQEIKLHLSAMDANNNTVLPRHEITGDDFSAAIPLEEGKYTTISIEASSIAGVTVTTSIRIRRGLNPETVYNSPLRPQLHFSPKENWMNDPNGLVFDPSDGPNGAWHMFFQHNPYSIYWGNMTWGHARSEDLVNWVEMPPAIYPDAFGTIFSGSAVVDAENHSGFFTNNAEGESKLIAFYTYDGGDNSYGNEKQAIAYSKDHGLTWTKPNDTIYSGNTRAGAGNSNIILSNEGNKYGGDFRDPKVFRHDGQWFLIVAGGRARLFTSSDLKNWTLESSFINRNGSELRSECPDFFPLPVDNNPENIKWVYCASGVYYIIGDLVKGENGKYDFVATTDQLTYAGGNRYATQSFFNDGAGKNRRLMVSWIQENADVTGQLSAYGKTWTGVQTLPLVTELRTIETGSGPQVRLVSNAPEEINKQRTDKIFIVENKVVSSGDANILSGLTGDKFDIEATFKLGSATEFGFNVRANEQYGTAIKYNASTKRLIIDRSKSGLRAEGIESFELYPKDGKITIRAIVDYSVIEAFGNNGDAPVIAQYYPSPLAQGMEFFATNGDVEIESLSIFNMKSIWKDDSVPAPADALKLFASAQSAIKDEIVTITALVLPSNAADKSVKWSIAGDEAFEIVTQTDRYITLKAVKTGICAISAVSSSNPDLADSVEIRVVENYFNSNMNWRAVSGNWARTPDGYRGANAGVGDCFAVSDKFMPAGKDYTIEADLTTHSGEAAGIVFGIGNPDAPASLWHCGNVHLSGTTGIKKLFKNTGGEVWNKTQSLTVQEAAKRAWHLRIDVSADGLLKYYVDGNLVGEQLESGFAGGYIGLVTFRADATFNNVIFTDASETPVSVFDFVAEPVSLTETKVSLKMSNYKAQNISLNLIIAMYDAAGRMVGANTTPVTLEPGKIEVIDGLACTSTAPYSKIKAMVWESGTFKPLHEALEKVLA